jgi:glucose 1-dehydrogenase
LSQPFCQRYASAPATGRGGGAKSNERSCRSLGQAAVSSQVTSGQPARRPASAGRTPPLGIAVIAIAPGLVRTPMTAERTENPETMRRQAPHIPTWRPGEPWEIAKLVLYLVSEDADYVTGQSFTIDGGLQMNWGQGA